MKLTGELKDKVDKAETMEEKKNIIAEAGIELTDDEVEDVAGGFGIRYIEYCSNSRCSLNGLSVILLQPGGVCSECGSRLVRR